MRLANYDTKVSTGRTERERNRGRHNSREGLDENDDGGLVSFRIYLPMLRASRANTCALERRVSLDDDPR